MWNLFSGELRFFDSRLRYQFFDEVARTVLISHGEYLSFSRVKSELFFKYFSIVTSRKLLVKITVNFFLFHGENSNHFFHVNILNLEPLYRNENLANLFFHRDKWEIQCKSHGEFLLFSRVKFESISTSKFKFFDHLYPGNKWIFTVHFSMNI